ncbi:MAG: hypothetical protein H6765_07330 [Candidatus Peribacteria bacterium]|nr:MAG: hypothetical protein H6765_07330 [Candidatus Peribacteria bacterium]
MIDSQQDLMCRCQKLVALLSLPSRVDKVLLVESLEVAKKQVEVFECLDDELKGQLKELEGAKNAEKLQLSFYEQQLEGVREITLRYYKIITFLEEVLEGIASSALGQERV